MIFKWTVKVWQIYFVKISVRQCNTFPTCVFMISGENILEMIGYIVHKSLLIFNPVSMVIFKEDDIIFPSPISGLYMKISSICISFI